MSLCNFLLCTPIYSFCFLFHRSLQDSYGVPVTHHR
jgi:hypothetical protein